MSAIAFLTRALVFCHCLGAELVELRRRAGVGAAILLDQVEAGEGDIELRLISELKNHQFERQVRRVLR